MSWTNGLCRAVGQDVDAPVPTFYSMILRIDLDDGSGSMSNKRVSCDLFEGRLPDQIVPDEAVATATNGVRFLGSFRSDENDTPATPDHLMLKVFEVLPLDSTTTSGVRSVLLSLLAPAAPEDKQPQLMVTGLVVEGGIGPTGPIKMEAKQLGPSLRSLTLQVDRVNEYPDPFDLVVPIPSPGQTTLRSALKAAGFAVLQQVGSAAIQKQSSWTVDQLRSIVATTPTQPNQPGDSLRRAGVFLSSYLMVVSQLDGASGIVGLMFDRTERLSAGIFYDTLRAQFSGDELAANYLFTLIHELGHSLNLPHVFDQHHLPGAMVSLPTFMNYPQKYTGTGGQSPDKPFHGNAQWDGASLANYQRFWSDFEFRFAPIELLELRHGARADLLTGAGVSAYRGDFSNTSDSLAIGGNTGAGLELTITVRGGGSRGTAGRSPSRPGYRPGVIFEFGEPVHVEARLRSHLAKPRAFQRRLSVVSPGMAIAYETPDGRCLQYEPPCEMSHLPTEKVLNADPKTPEPDAFYKHICLSAGPDPRGFLTPGRYRIRAAYRYHDTLLLSNILTLFVRYPVPEVEDLVMPMIEHEVADYFQFRGVHGLKRAEPALESVLGDDPRKLDTRSKRHPLSVYRCAYEARMRAKGIVEFRSRTRMVELVSKPNDALAWFPPAFGLNDLSELNTPSKSTFDNLPFSNIELAKLGKVFHEVLIEAKELGLAAALLTRLDLALKGRGVPGNIRRQCLPHATATSSARRGPRSRSKVTTQPKKADDDASLNVTE